MIENIRMERGDVVVTGTVERDLQVDGAEVLATYDVRIDDTYATFLAADLAARHEGIRLYPAEGEYGPFDGQVHEVVEIGTHWYLGRPSLMVTVTGTEVPRLDGRYAVEYLSTEEARLLVAVMSVAAD